MATQMIVPILGESIHEAVLLKWWKSEGDSVKRGEEIAEIETAKANMALECPANGILLSIQIAEGETIRTGDLLAVIGKSDEALPEVASVGKALPTNPGTEPAIAAASEAEEPASNRMRISPAARKLAADLKVELSQVLPAVPGARITTEDVQRSYDQALAEQAKPETNATASGDLPGHHVALTEMRRLTGQRMLESVQSIPQFSVSADADVTRLLAIKDSLNRDHKQPQDKITLTALIIYLTARALRKNPELNARFDDGSLWVYDTVHMAVAIDTPRGLAAPVIPQLEKLSVTEVARKLNALVEATRGGHLSFDQVSSGTFSISNLGMQRVSQFTPIINPPQAAILGIGAARPAVLPLSSGGTQHVKLMSLTLTADHRVVDGAGAARFISDLCTEIETYSEE
jgi:pyruvate dehydrogenase E2 component (dihydrolipoamide acetyltransferase)